MPGMCLLHTGHDVVEPPAVGVGGVAGRRCSPVGVLLPQQPKAPGSPAVGTAADGAGSAVQPTLSVSSRTPATIGIAFFYTYFL